MWDLPSTYVEATFKVFAAIVWPDSRIMHIRHARSCQAMPYRVWPSLAACRHG